MDEERLAKQLKVLYNQFRKSRFSKAQFRGFTRSMSGRIYFEEETKDSKTFERYLRRLDKEGYLNYKRKECMLTDKAVELVKKIEYEETVENTKRFLTYINANYSLASFTYLQLSKALEAKNAPDFADCFVGVKSFETFIRFAIDRDYVNKKGREYWLTPKRGVRFVKKKIKDVPAGKPAFTKEELINLTMGKLYMCSDQRGDFTKMDYDYVKEELIYMADFSESWEEYIGDPNEMGSWLMDKGYIKSVTDRRESKSRLKGKGKFFRINKKKWEPTAQQKKERLKKEVEGE